MELLSRAGPPGNTRTSPRRTGDAYRLRLQGEPDPVAAAALAELAGARGIIAHLREDRRHVQDRDLRLLRDVVQTMLNMEMAATDEMQRIAREIKPDFSTLVPEKREELTTEGGLEVASRIDFMRSYINRLQQGGIVVSLFVDPDDKQVSAARKSGADWVEVHRPLRKGIHIRLAGEDIQAGLALVASQARADTPERKIGRYNEADDLESHGTSQLAADMSAKLTADPGLQAKLKQLILRQSPAGLAEALRAMAERPDSTPYLESFEFPMAIIHGKDDKLIPLERAREVMEKVKQGTLLELEGAGHMPMMEAPQATAGELIKLLV